MEALNRTSVFQLFMVALLFLVIELVDPMGVSAQRYNPSLERQLIREAAGHQGRGNLAEAERVLRVVLSANPTSDVGLLAMEKVFSEQGSLKKILPLIDNYLEDDPKATVARGLKLDVYRNLDELERLHESAEEWLAIAGNKAEPYRKVSQVFLEVYGQQEALEVLRRGEEAMGESSQFSLGIGDLLIELEEYDSAAIAWAKGIGHDGSQTSAVIRRVVALDVEDRRSVGVLLDQLKEEPTTTARVRGATRIALEVGMVEQALELAILALENLEGQGRRGFLTVLAREAEEVKGGEEVALWAYEAIREQALDLAEIKALNYRIASTALEMGDTLRSLNAQYAIADALPEGNPERRRALAAGLRMTVASGARDQMKALDDFKNEFPDAVEIDELSVLIAVGLDLAGDEVLARSMLEGIEGPRSDLERGYLHLLNNEIDLGTNSLMASASGLPPHQATDVLTLLDYIGRLQGHPLESVARAAVFEHRGQFDESLLLIETELEGPPSLERPVLLAFSARIAEKAGMVDRAASFRKDIVKDYPRSLEYPRAALELARFMGISDQHRQQAITLLEDLIVSRPNSAIAPLARRELRRLGGD